MGKINQAGMQVMLETAYEVAEGYRYRKGAIMLTQWSLRTEVAMAANTTSYNLPMTTQQSNNAAIASLRLLKNTDVLFVYGIRIYVGKAGSTTGAANQLYTFGDAAAFNTTTSGADINTAYSNGVLQLNMNKQQVLPAWDLQKHYRAPITQTTANADYTTSGINYVNSMDGSEDSFYPVAPMFIISGDQDIELNLNLIAAQAAITSNSRWVVFFDGFLAQNATRTANPKLFID